MLYRALSLSFLLSSLLSAGDNPEPNFTVKMVDPTPQNPPQMPKVDFQNPYATGGGGGGNSSPDVGSNTGGSALNFLGAVADYIKGPQPDYDKMRRDTKNEKFIECISKYGPQTAAQFYPAETAAYMQKQSEREWAELFKQQAAAPKPAPVVAAPVVAPTPAPVVAVVAPTPTPAPVVAAPVVSTPTVLTTTSLVVTSSPAPVIAAPVPAPANPSSIIPGLGTTPAFGGLQGNTQLLKPPFTVYNPGKVPTLGELIPNQSYIKPMVTPPPVPNPINPNYTPPSAPSALEVAGAGAATVGMWGSIKGAAVACGVAVKGAVVAATPYVVAVVTSPYVVVPAVIGGGAYIGYKLGTRSVRLREEAAQAAREATVHRQIHETVHTPAPQPSPMPQITPHRNLPANLQPSDNPIKLGKKIYQPGPQPGQGDRPHGYKDKWGHYRDYTPENVAHAIESVEKGVYHGQDGKSGRHIYTYNCPKTGLQKWAEVDNTGGILNCGINEVPHTFCQTTKKLKGPEGFVKPTGSGKGWVDKTLKVGIGGSVFVESTIKSMNEIAQRLEKPIENPMRSAKWDELENTMKNIASSEYSLPPAPRDITVHDLEAERMIKNHYVAMEQKKVITIQDRIKKEYKKRYYL